MWRLNECMQLFGFAKRLTNASNGKNEVNMKFKAWGGSRSRF